MALLDRTPGESAPGIAVASGALLTALLDALIVERTFDRHQVNAIILTAQTLVSGYSDSPMHDDARFVLDRMLKRFAE